MLSLILKESFFSIRWEKKKNFQQIHWGHENAGSFCQHLHEINSAEEILRLSIHEPLRRKRYIDDVISLWDMGREEIDRFIEHANSFHPTVKFTTEFS